jgi:hypothetical protein
MENNNAHRVKDINNKIMNKVNCLNSMHTDLKVIIESKSVEWNNTVKTKFNILKNRINDMYFSYSIYILPVITTNRNYDNLIAGVKRSNMEEEIKEVFQEICSMQQKLVQYIKDTNEVKEYINAHKVEKDKLLKAVSRVHQYAQHFTSIGCFKTNVPNINILQFCTSSDCKAPLEINTDMNLAHCHTCGRIVTITGIVFPSGEPMAVTNKYDRITYSDDWVNAIQGIEQVDIPSSLILALQKKKHELNILDKRKITCAVIREWLKDIKIPSARSVITGTKYNPHIPKIRYILINVQAEIFYHDELRKINDYLEKYFRLINENKGQGESKNVSYHPHPLLKIVEYVIPRNTKQERERFARIISCFHLQRTATVEQKDIEWSQHCIKLGIPFVATNCVLYRGYINDGGEIG